MRETGLCEGLHVGKGSDRGRKLAGREEKANEVQKEKLPVGGRGWVQLGYDETSSNHLGTGVCCLGENLG